MNHQLPSHHGPANATTGSCRQDPARYGQSTQRWPNQLGCFWRAGRASGSSHMPPFCQEMFSRNIFMPPTGVLDEQAAIVLGHNRGPARARTTVSLFGPCGRAAVGDHHVTPVTQDRGY
jgi:hypothetical protein